MKLITAYDLHQWQTRTGLTNEEACQRLGTTRNTYSRWRNAHNKTPRWLDEAMKRVEHEVMGAPAKPKKATPNKPGFTPFQLYTVDGKPITIAERNQMPAGSLYWEVEANSVLAYQCRHNGQGLSPDYTGLSVPLAQAGIG